MTELKIDLNAEGLPQTSAGTEPGRGRLQGERVLILGGGQRVFDAATDPIGNGRASSLLAAREGAHVVVVDKNLASAQATVDLITDAGGTAVAIDGDVSSPDAVARVIETAVGYLGGIDGLLYNVGIGITDLDLDGVQVEEWDRVFAVNVRGAMLCLREALPHMSNGGSIVVISSTAGLHSGSRLIAYESSKAALAGLMRSVAREGSGRGIRTNIICPGLVDTPNGRTAGAGRRERANSFIPLGRMATAWDIAYAVLFFLSAESNYVSAQILAVDGGRTGV